MDYDQKFDDDFRELFTKHLREHEGFGKELWLFDLQSGFYI